jgi:hypothetical protein
VENVGEELGTIGLPEWERAKPGPVWRWWLGNGMPDGRGLRRWQLWIWWTRQRGIHMQFLAFVRFFRGYVEAPLEAWGGMRRFGDKTFNIYGVPRATQFWSLLLLRVRFGIRPDSYYKFQMFRPERFSNAPQFVEESGQLLQVVCRHSPRSPDERLFLSKEEFRRWCQGKGIPTVQNLLEIAEGRVVSRHCDPLPAVDLFVKPTNWRQGKGVSRWQCISSAGKHYYRQHLGRLLDPVEFENFVCGVSLEQGRPYIVQPALTNHHELRGFTNGALATVRLMTVRDIGGSARPLMAAMRMPTGDAVADNFDLGGVATAIDMETGECGPGIRKKGQYPPNTVTSHPDTGQAIPGLKIPWWAECVGLTCRAHDLIDAQVPVIGWDVAVLENGPVIVEPNHLPCGNLAQMPAGFPLGKSQFAEVIVRRLRASFLSRQ